MRFIVSRILRFEDSSRQMQIELRRLPKEQVASFQFGGEGLALEDLELMVHIDLISILKYKAAKGELGEFFG